MNNDKINNGRLVVISGFSGAGKGTIVKELIARYGYSLSVSATTRAPREGEENGKDYYFKTVDEFRTLIDYNGFIEWTQYVDNYYGTPRKYVEDELAEGRTVILEIEVKGAENIKKQYPDAVLLFVTTKDVETLRARLVKRGTEAPEVIEKRISRAAEEAEYMDGYDYIIVNDELENTVATVQNIIESCSYRTANSQDFIKQIKNDLNNR